MSIRRIATPILLFVVPAAACAQTAPNLDDSFAVSALKTLRLIETENGEFSLGADGSILAPRESGEAISDLDAEARTKIESNVVDALKTFLTERLEHNNVRTAVAEIITVRQIEAEKPEDPITVGSLVSQTHTVKAIEERESACTGELEQELRQRSFHGASACTEGKLDVDTPKPDDHNL